MELALLDNTFNLSLNDIIPSGVLQASHGNKFTSIAQEIEIRLMSSKDCLIPSRQVASLKDEGDYVDAAKVGTVYPNAQFMPIENMNLVNMDEEGVKNLKFVFLNVTMSEEKRMFLKNKFNIDDRQITEILTKAVDQSISEILQPVVDRSVTIALITTKQLVLKDFAMDGNPTKLQEALEQ